MSILSLLSQEYKTINKKYKVQLKNKILLKNENENQNDSDQNINEVIDELFNHKRINEKILIQKYQIYYELLKKNYKLVNYIDSGGQADIFYGQLLIKGEIKQDYVFKIYYETTDEEFKNEIEIMKSFEKPINVVKIIDSLQIDYFLILVLEKCQKSLKKELQQIQEGQNVQLVFSVDKLFQIIFDLLDGLIQFRIYNILHLDIKPGNILITKEGDYCYSDFGTSHNIKVNKEIQCQYFTRSYASPEQQDNNKPIDYQSDVFSLGKTFKNIINIFKKVNNEYKQNLLDLIKNFEVIINENMIQNDSSQRSKCQNLHEQFIMYQY